MKTSILCILIVLSYNVLFSQESAVSSDYQSGRVTIHTYAVSGFASVNTHWIETQQSIVLIDAQRSISSAERLIELLQATGKTVEAIILTHGHPDHYGGVPTLIKAFPNANVYASARTAAIIKTDELGYNKATKSVLNEDFVESFLLPIKTFENGEKLNIAGLDFTCFEAGPGEAPDMSLIYLSKLKALFTGDIIANNMTPFLIEGRSSEWLNQLQFIESKFSSVETIYPGHGFPGTFYQLIINNKQYIEKLRGLVARKAADGKLDTEEIKSIKIIMAEKYPGYLPVAAIPNLLDLNIEAIKKELDSNR